MQNLASDQQRHAADLLFTPLAAYPPGPWKWDGYCLADKNGRAILFAEEVGPRVAARCNRAELDAALAEGHAMVAVIVAGPQLVEALNKTRGVLTRIAEHNLAAAHPGLVTDIEAAIADASAALLAAYGLQS